MLLPIDVGERRLAIDARCVVEVLGARPWIAIPNAPTAIPGATAWRGRALALLELGVALGQPTITAPESRARNLVVRISDDLVVLGADRVLEARTSGPLAFSHAIEFELPRLGDTLVDERLVPVLDLERWVRANRRST
ncbi:chemotaxis protein CheW [Nannocystaceae bacterium ST9]